MHESSPRIPCVPMGQFGRRLGNIAVQLVVGLLAIERGWLLTVRHGIEVWASVCRRSWRAMSHISWECRQRWLL